MIALQNNQIKFTSGQQKENPSANWAIQGFKTYIFQSQDKDLEMISLNLHGMYFLNIITCAIRWIIWEHTVRFVNRVTWSIRVYPMVYAHGLSFVMCCCG